MKSRTTMFAKLTPRVKSLDQNLPFYVLMEFLIIMSSAQLKENSSLFSFFIQTKRKMIIMNINENISQSCQFHKSSHCQQPTAIELFLSYILLLQFVFFAFLLFFLYLFLFVNTSKVLTLFLFPPFSYGCCFSLTQSNGYREYKYLVYLSYLDSVEL